MSRSVGGGVRWVRYSAELHLFMSIGTALQAVKGLVSPEKRGAALFSFKFSGLAGHSPRLYCRPQD